LAFCLNTKEMGSNNIAIDVGNSSTKIGVFNRGLLIQTFTIKNPDLKKNRELLYTYPAEKYILSSVNTEVERLLDVSKIEGKLLRLDTKTKLPIKIAYQSPDSLGKDRVAVAVAAFRLFSHQNVLVIDAGSCMTYDVVTIEGVYLGGGISPGIQMRLKALNRFTDGLPLLVWEESERPKNIGTTTISSMLSGVINGLILEINGFIDEYRTQFSDLKIVLTGGDANFFEKELKNSIFADPNLVLKGLNEILEYNHS